MGFFNSLFKNVEEEEVSEEEVNKVLDYYINKGNNSVNFNLLAEEGDCRIYLTQLSSVMQKKSISRKYMFAMCQLDACVVETCMEKGEEQIPIPAEWGYPEKRISIYSLRRYNLRQDNLCYKGFYKEVT